MSDGLAATGERLIESELSRTGWTWDRDVQPDAVAERVLFRTRSISPRMAHADYLLRFHQMPVGILEVFSETRSITDALVDAETLARRLHLRFAIASNGKHFVVRNLETGTEDSTDESPNPEVLMQRRGLVIDWPTWAKTFETPWFHEDSAKGIFSPRLFQQVAIFEMLASVASATPRALVTMPTGAGKTVVTIQFIWKLLKGGAFGSRRILVVADHVAVLAHTNSLVSKLSGFQTVWLDHDSLSTGIIPDAHIFLRSPRRLSSSRQGGKLYELLNPEKIAIVICLDLHRSLGAGWMDILDRLPNAHQVALVSSSSDDSLRKSDVYQYFTAPGGGKPIYSMSLSAHGIMTPISGQLANSPFAPAQYVPAVAVSILLKLAHDENPHLFSSASHWDNLLIQPATELRRYVSKHFFPKLRSLQNPRLRFSNFLEEVLNSDSIHADLLAITFAGLAPYDLSKASNRRTVARELDSLFDASLGSRFEGGEARTPTALATWIAEILSPKRGESIYDPHCGAGSLLLALLNQAASDPTVNSQRESIVQIFGVEPKSQFCLLTLARLSLAKGSDLDLKSLSLPELLSSDSSGEKYDCIATNPPFGMRVDDATALLLPVRVRTSQAALLLHSLMRLRTGGRAAILVPDSILFNWSDRPLREFILTHFCVDAVVGLPERTFGGRTVINTSLLVLRNDKPAESVLFVSRAFTDQLFNRPASVSSLLRRLLSSVLHHSIGLDKECVEFHEAWSDLSALLAETRNRGGRDEQKQDLNSAFAAAMDLVFTTPDPQLSLRGDNPKVPSTMLPREAMQWLASTRLQKSAWRTNVSDLVQRDFQLLPQDPGNQALQNLLTALGKQSEPVAIRKLWDIASVYAGMRPDRNSIFHYRENAPPPESSYNDVLTARDLEPIIRETTCSRWVGPDVYSVQPPKYKLQENDILLAAHGQIGAVAIYKDDFVRHPYSDLIVIRLHDESLLPDYLWRLLQTEPYQLWLKGHAAGSTIRRLSARVLAELSIPIPPIEFQRQIVEGFKGRESVDTLLSALTQLRPVSAAFRFLTDDESAIQFASLQRKDLTPALCMPLLRDLITKWTASTKLATEEMTRHFALGIFLKWADDRLTHLNDLVSILDMPDGADRYIALQTWERYGYGEEATPIPSLEDSDESVSLTDPLLVQALKARLASALAIFNQLSALVYIECQRLMEAATMVSATISPSVISPNRESTLTATVTNETFFGLRFLLTSISERESGGSYVPYLAPGHSHSWTIKLTPDRTARIPVEINWVAQRLDGELRDGAVALAVEAQELESSVPITVLDKTPYIVGPFITGDKQGMFFGRQQVVDEIKRSLRTDGPSTVLVVEGNRRLGKSSLLIHLQQESVLPGWIPVYLSFQRVDGVQGKDGFATSTVFYNIAKTVLAGARAGGVKIRIPECGEVPSFAGLQPNKSEVVDFTAFARQKLKPLFDGDNPFESLQLVVESIIAAIGSRRVLLMLDEFDKLQVGIDNGVTSPLVPEHLRSLFHTYPQISGILAGSRRMREMRNQYFNALFGLGKNLRISALDPQSAAQLITEPVKGRLVYPLSAVEFLIRETACQPFLIQGVCDRIFSLCASSPEEDRVVTYERAKKAADLFAQDNEHFSQVWFDDIKTDFRHFILCLVDSFSQGPDPVTADFILLQMESSGVDHVNLKELGDDLDELVGLEILAQEGDRMQTTYRFNIPLLARWMRQNIDYRRYRLAARMEKE